MNWSIYKEGQGKWARNSIAGVIALFAIIAAARTYNGMEDPVSLPDEAWLHSWLAVKDWGWVDYRLLFVAPLLIGILAFGVWQYNHPRWADFLIDTENELKNRVTWPGQKELVNLSVVVVIATIVIGAYTFGVDTLLKLISGLVF